MYQTTTRLKKPASESGQLFGLLSDFGATITRRPGVKHNEHSLTIRTAVMQYRDHLVTGLFLMHNDNQQNLSSTFNAVLRFRRFQCTIYETKRKLFQAVQKFDDSLDQPLL
jgi:hypothetical protein